MPDTGTPSFAAGLTLPVLWESLPVAIHGGTLAALGLSLLLPIAWPCALSRQIAQGLSWVGMLLLAWCCLAQLGKALWAPAALTADLRNPATGLFAGQLGIALALVCEGMRDYGMAGTVLAFMSSAVLAAVALLHAGWLVVTRWPGWQSASPGWLLPGLQWAYLALLSGHFAPEFQPALTAVAAVLSVGSSAALAWRWRNGHPWPDALRPGLSLWLAVPALWLLLALQAMPASYTEGHSIKFNLFLQALLLGALVIAWLMAIARVSSMQPTAFNSSWWAYGMPLSAAALSVQAMSKAWEQPLFLHSLALALSVSAVLGTLILFILVIRHSLSSVQRFRHGNA